MLVAAGGVLLFVPGLVTDVAGLLLLLPPVRHVVRNRLVRAAEARVPELRTARIRSGATIVDGDVVRPRRHPGDRGPALLTLHVGRHRTGRFAGGVRAFGAGSP